MARYFGNRYTVWLYVFFKVAMAKCKDKEEIEEEAFNATCRLYENEPDATVLDNRVMEIDNTNKFFTFVDVGLEIKVDVVADDFDEAYMEGEAFAGDIIHRLPAGVVYTSCDAFDAEYIEPAIDYDWVVGE